MVIKNCSASIRQVKEKCSVLKEKYGEAFDEQFSVFMPAIKACRSVSSMIAMFFGNASDSRLAWLCSRN